MRTPLAGRPLVPLFLLWSAACGSAPTTTEPAFLEVEWVIVAVDGTAIEADSTRPAPTLRVNRADQGASGHAGCNRFGGSWQGDGDSLSFGPLMMTRMFCEGRMELEAQYTQALGAVTRVRVVSDTLELLAGERVVVRARRRAP